MTDEAMTDEQTRVLKFALRRLISQGYALMDDAAQHGDEHKNRGSIDAIQKDIETAEECLKFFEPKTEDIETQHIKGLAKVLRDHADSFMPGAVHEALTAGADALEEKLTYEGNNKYVLSGVTIIPNDGLPDDRSVVFSAGNVYVFDCEGNLLASTKK